MTKIKIKRKQIVTTISNDLIIYKNLKGHPNANQKLKSINIAIYRNQNDLRSSANNHQIKQELLDNMTYQDTCLIELIELKLVKDSYYLSKD